MSIRMRMTRRVSFASGHRYWDESLDLSGNRMIFGPLASPYNHGHNYVLEATVEGEVEPQTGMIVNIKRIDNILKEHVVILFDQKSINDEVPGFESRAPSLENILNHIHGSIPPLPDGVRLVGLKLNEMPGFYGELELDRTTPTMTMTRTYEFAAAQRLHAPQLSEEANRELYGVCNNREGYGHNYILEVTVSGQPDHRTGFLCDIVELDRIVKTDVIDRYDHKNLFRDLPEFEGRITTCENIIRAIYDALFDRLPAKLHRIRLWETARNMFELVAD